MEAENRLWRATHPNAIKLRQMIHDALSDKVINTFSPSSNRKSKGLSPAILRNGKFAGNDFARFAWFRPVCFEIGDLYAGSRPLPSSNHPDRA